jgi:hypothetical protein
VSELLDRVRAFLPGENVRYVFAGEKAFHPALRPIIRFCDIIQVPTHAFRIVAITEAEIIVMKGADWTVASRRARWDLPTDPVDQPHPQTPALPRGSRRSYPRTRLDTRLPTNPHSRRRQLAQLDSGNTDSPIHPAATSTTTTTDPVKTESLI